MKRIYSLFLVMLLCLVGTTAFARTKDYAVVYSGNQAEWVLGTDYGYTIKQGYSVFSEGVTTEANASTLTMRKQTGNPTTLSTNNITNYITPIAHSGYDVAATVSGTTITIAYTKREAVTKDYSVSFVGNQTGWALGTDYGYTVKRASSESQEGVSTSANASKLTMCSYSGTPTTLTTSNLSTYITPIAHDGYELAASVSGTTITISYTKIVVGSLTVACVTTGGGLIYNGETYSNGATVPEEATLEDCTIAPIEGMAGKVSQSGTTLTVSYIPVGRVFIKSNATPMYTASTNQDADDDMYLTSLSNVMGLSWGATNYWSIWDATYDEATGTVTFVNEGNRDIMTPLQRYSATSTRDAGYLHYNIDENVNTGYGVGNCTDASKRNFEWEVNSDGTFILRAQAAESTNYMYFDNGYGSGSNEGGVTNTGDHVAKSGSNTANNKNQWIITHVSAEDEAAMFARNVQELNGYVGGVVTLTHVEQVEQLNSINRLDKTSCEEILAGDQDGALKMKAVLDIIKDANEFGQELVAERPFFLENMSSYRPQVYSRLVYNGTSGTTWRTTKRANVDMDTPTGVFYVDKNSDGNYVAWIKDGSTTRYISNQYSNTTTYALSSNVPTAGTSIANALNFDIDPIIPGIWRIRDVKMAEASDTQKTKRYLTITQSNGTFYVTHYEVTEPSTLWKFKTYTTFDYTLKADPEGGVSYCTGYTTYGQYMDSKLPATTGVKAWLASGIEWRDNEMHVIMREANHGTDEMKQDCYWMKAGYGYLITKEGSSSTDAGTVNDNQLARFIPDADYKTGNVKFAEEDGVANYFKPIPNDGKVTEEDWEKWFYFSYVPTGQTYTHYKGEDVKGVGVGFYRLQPGKTYKRGKARLAYSDIFDDPTKEVTEWTSTATKGQMIFVDADGETTDVVTIGADGSLYHEVDTYFDLSGRRVQNPSNGVFIKNGKKVWVK